MKFLFLPVSIGAGLAAGVLSKKLFELIWGVIDDQEPPEPKHREIALAKLVPALAIEGAVFRLMKGLADHGSRHGFMRLSGTWPGDERPEPE
ncbi:MAG: DUF4235 domain-containing protein [Actinomycetota bacterium]|nr:DUF4235 domain-containing protein [Actinomycetota bacterium]